MIFNAYTTTKQKNPQIKHRDLCIRIHQTLGVGIKTVYRVTSQATKKRILTDNRNENVLYPKIFDRMSQDSKDKLRQVVHNLMKELPKDENADSKYVTVTKVHEKVSSLAEIPKMGKRTLHKILKLLGFW